MEKTPKTAEEAFEKMLQNEECGGNGWWEGWEELKQAYQQPEPEQITPEALEKEGFEKINPIHYYKNGIDITFHKPAFIVEFNCEYPHVFKGVTTMQDLRDLIKLIG